MNAIAQGAPAIRLERPAVTSDRVTELGETISASRLGLWLQCRLKFFFRYVMRVPKPPTGSMHAGTTVHRVLQEWSLARLHGQALPLEHWQQRFQRQWITLQQNLRIVWHGEEGDQFQSAWRVLKHYFRATPIQEDEAPEAVEVPLEQELDASGAPKLVGIIDLIRPVGRITDFKIVGRTPDAGQLVQVHELQLTAYSILYRARTGRKEAGLELHHLVRTKLPRLIVSSLPPATERQHTRFFRLVGSYMEGLRRRDFVPSPGLQCAACEYFDQCREWCG